MVTKQNLIDYSKAKEIKKNEYNEFIKGIVKKGLFGHQFILDKDELYIFDEGEPNITEEMNALGETRCFATYPNHQFICLCRIDQILNIKQEYNYLEINTINNDIFIDAKGAIKSNKSVRKLVYPYKEKLEEYQKEISSLELKLLDSLYKIQNDLVEFIIENNLSNKIEAFDYKGYGFRETVFKDKAMLSLVKIDYTNPTKFSILPRCSYTGIGYMEIIYPNIERKEEYITMSKEECYHLATLIDDFVHNVFFNIGSKLLSR